MIKRYPKRFLAFAPISALAGKSPVEMERAVGSLGFKGVLKSILRSMALPGFKRIMALLQKGNVPQGTIFVPPERGAEGFDILNCLL